MADEPKIQVKQLAPEVQPLPVDQIPVLFEKIQKKEKISVATLHQALRADQLTLRARAAQYLGDIGQTESIPFLIDSLSDESAHVGVRYSEEGMNTTRYWANHSLVKITGRNFGFVWNDPIGKRSAAIIKWRTWYVEYLSSP